MTRPLCSCTEPQLVAPDLLLDASPEQQGFAIDRCEVCDLAWTSPQPTPEQLNHAYDEHYYNSTTAKFNPLIEWWTRYSARRRAGKLIRRHASKRGSLRVLDIGCGRGVLLDGFRRLGHDVLGLERPGTGFSDLQGIEDRTLDDLIESGEKFDIVILWHVLEHLDAPLQTLKAVNQLLKEQGSLFVEVPNYDGFQARLFGANWFHLDIPRHLFHFTAGSLVSLTTESELRIEKISTFSLDQNYYGFLQSLLNSLPLLPYNHLYSLLQSRLSPRTLCLLALYLPLLLLAALPALLDLIVSSFSSTGSVISMHLRKEDDA